MGNGFCDNPRDVKLLYTNILLERGVGAQSLSEIRCAYILLMDTYTIDCRSERRLCNHKQAF